MKSINPNFTKIAENIAKKKPAYHSDDKKMPMKKKKSIFSKDK